MTTTGESWRTAPEHQEWLREQMERQLHFGRAFPLPEGGAAWLDGSGRPVPSQPTFTYATARMAHVYSLGALAGDAWCEPLADAALAGLTGRLRDPEHGGWFAALGPGTDRDDTKQAYTHAFVLLAASTALTAGRPGAQGLLDDVTEVLATRFLDGGSGCSSTGGTGPGPGWTATAVSTPTCTRWRRASPPMTRPASRATSSGPR